MKPPRAFSTARAERQALPVVGFEAALAPLAEMFAGMVVSAILEKLDSIEASKAKQDFALTTKQAASEFKISPQELRFLVQDGILSNKGSPTKILLLRHELEAFTASRGAP